MLPIDRLPTRHCISSVPPFSYRIRTRIERQTYRISLMKGTVHRRRILASVTHVAGASAFTVSKNQVFSEETDVGVIQRTMFSKFGLPR